jgi:hypothetical protein
LIKDEEASTPSGFYKWKDVKNSVASGIYIYLITNKNHKSMGKIGIIK